MSRYRIDPMPAPADPSLLTALEQIETATLGHVRLTGMVCFFLVAFLAWTKLPLPMIASLSLLKLDR